MCRYPVGKLKESEQERPAEVSKRKEQVGQFFAKLAEMQDAEQFEIREFVAQGVKVVVIGHYRLRVKFTGHYAHDWLHVFTIHDGKVSNLQEYLDTHAWVLVGLICLYARPFTNNRPVGPLPEEIVPEEYLSLHRDIITMCHRLFAYGDASVPPRFQ